MPTPTTSYHHSIPPDFQRLVPGDSLSRTANAQDGSHDDWYLSANDRLTRHRNHLATMREADPVDIKDPIYWGRQFRDIVCFVPLCNGLGDSFEPNTEGHMEQTEWVYWVVDGDFKIYQSSEDAFEAWKRVGKLLGTIYVTADLDSARTHNEIALTIGAMLGPKG
ncbi:hypothetical protein K438DRAFT_1955478 [Mycena galopus ATCC 62051]|nr:hypothetical protein K438DRAFT_1955478 [Mycena galopus ATCC 62051]